jgi:membrane protease YdiL (CAAX protease family)
MSNIFIPLRKEDENLKVRMLSITTWLFVIVTVILTVQFFRYVNSPVEVEAKFGRQNLLFLIFNSLFATSWIGRWNIDPYTQEEFMEDGGWYRTLWQFAILLGCIAGLNFILAAFIELEPYQITPFEYYLFFFCSACSEEYFFRGLVLVGLLNVLSLGDEEGKNSMSVKLFSVIGSGVIFGLSHIFVYQGNWLMLASTTFGGMLLSLFYVLSDNLIVCILAHAILNLIVTANQLQTLSIVNATITGQGEFLLILIVGILVVNIHEEMVQNRRYTRIMCLYIALDTRCIIPRT